MEDKLFELIVVMPQGISFKGKAERVELNTSEGEIGVLKGHIPLTAVIRPGKLKITAPEGNQEIHMSGGIITILPEKIIVAGEGGMLST